MRSIASRRLMAAVLAGLLAVASAAAAPVKKKATELVEAARLTKEEFVKLIAKFDEVADIVEKAEPQTAKVLRDAASKARRALIADNMDEVMVQVQKGLMTMAARTSKEVRDALDEVLRILRQGALDLDKRLKRMEEWKKTMEDLEALLRKQKELERNSRPKAHGDELDKQMRAHAAALADIIAKQKALLAQAGKMGPGKPGVRKLADLRDEVRELIKNQEKIHSATTSSSPAKLPLGAGTQKKLGGEAKKTQGKLDAAAKDPKLSASLSKAGADPKAVASAAAKVGQAASEMGQASKSMAGSKASQASKSQQNALHDLKAAEKALTDAIAKASEKTPPGQMAKGQKDLADQTGKLGEKVQKTADKAGMESKAGNLAKAAGEMSKASDKLGEQNPKGASENMKNALKELEDKQHKLADLQRRMQQKAKDPIQKQAKPQGDLAKKTDQKAQDMKPSDASQQPQPGQQSVASASKSMGKASKSAGKGQAGQTNQQQQDAIDQLEKAKQDLQEAIAREQEMIQAEALAKIDQMLRKILESQQNITLSTEKTHARRKGKTYARTDQAQLRELSQGEGRLVEDVTRILQMLAKEGTTAVFPEVLGEVKKDMSHVQKQLAKLEAGPLTQAVEHDIERSLKDMLEALRKEQGRRRKKKKSGGGKGGGGGGKQPLVPPVAELRMLKILQVQILGRTALLSKQVAKKKSPPDQIKQQHKTLSERQGKVKTMTKTLGDKLKAGQRPGPARID